MGLSVSRELAVRGATVVMLDINQSALEHRASDIPGRIEPVGIDISDETAVRRVTEYINASLGCVSILVNNAGVLSKNRIERTDMNEWNRVLAINLTGSFLMIRYVLPEMRTNRYGRIVNVSSFAAFSGGVTAGLAYTVSKGGLVALTRAVAAETASDGVTCNAIAPAWVRTPMVTDMLTEKEQAETMAQIPVGRFSEPEEFTHSVLFLVSEKAGFVTGETIHLNGGARFS